MGSAEGTQEKLQTVDSSLRTAASKGAKEAIAPWIKGERYKSSGVADAVIAGFRNIYGDRLLSLTSFLRSAGLSICAVLLYFVYSIFDLNDLDMWSENLKLVLVFVAPPIIISDYCSIFGVRTALQIARSSLPRAIFLATMVGVASVLVVTVIEWRVGDYLFGWLDTLGPPDSDYHPDPIIIQLLRMVKTAAPAFLVHLWLPLLLLGALMNILLAMFFRGVGFAQWFLDRGDRHPLEAIGLMASLVVFAVVVGAQEIIAVI